MNKQMLISEPRITEDFINMGAILVYLKNISEEFNLAFALPFQDGNDFFYYLMINGHETFNDGIVLMVISVDNVNPVWDEYEGNVEVRYVLLPDGIPAKIADGFFEDYEAVAEFFGIKD